MALTPLPLRPHWEGSWRMLPPATAHPEKANVPARCNILYALEPRVKLRAAHLVDADMEGNLEDIGFLQSLPLFLL